MKRNNPALKFYLCLNKTTGDDGQVLQQNLVKLKHFIVSERLAIIADEREPSVLVKAVHSGITDTTSVTLIELADASVLGSVRVSNNPVERAFQAANDEFKTVFD